MPLIGYFKGQPNEYVIKYSSGRIAREGQGLAFFYLKYKTQIVAVPTSSMDANLVFNEVTSSFQTVTIQGQFTYRIHNPKRAAELLNFTMNPFTHMHVSNDPDRLAQRITNIIQRKSRYRLLPEKNGVSSRERQKGLLSMSQVPYGINSS